MSWDPGHYISPKPHTLTNCKSIIYMPNKQISKCRQFIKENCPKLLLLISKFCITWSLSNLLLCSVQFSSITQSCPTLCDPMNHSTPGLPCPSPTPRVHSDSRPSSQWCHPAILSSVVPFSSCPQSLPASESFPMSQLFAWGGQSTRVSALASFLPKKSQGWSPCYHMAKVISPDMPLPGMGPQAWNLIHSNGVN